MRPVGFDQHEAINHASQLAEADVEEIELVEEREAIEDAHAGSTGCFARR
jgi:hypothetical protein